ncbi:MAG: ATP-dependent DNA helicase RecG [Saccharofermentans sp.]|jgi:ATP-dependent DNA helicase RecG|nr:ATP-dependent DNA helicase RecG [Saccharofermentans sp.]
MPAIHLSNPVTDLYGIGPSAEEKLAKLDIYTIYDLIAFIPWRYDDWSHLGTIASFDMADRFDDSTGYDLSFRGTVSTNPSVNVTSRKKPLTFFVSDGTGRIRLTFFNSQYLAGKFTLGDECFVHGSVTLFNGQMQMVNPYIEKAEKISDDALVRPVYHLTAGITSNNISKWVKTALKLCGEELMSCIPSRIAEEKGFVSPLEAYEKAHFPSSLEEARKAREQLAYEELILLGIGMKLYSTGHGVKEVAEQVIPSGSDGIGRELQISWNQVKNNLGFTLTADQASAFRDVQTDLMSTVPMNRLIQGDVGSGKTAVAALSMIITALMGKQAVLLAPTSVLATQHFKTIYGLMKNTGMEPVLLLGKTKPSEKQEIKEMIADGRARVIIGTHALLTDDVRFKDLALVIADEQHRFGVRQREKLLFKDTAKDGTVKSVHNLIMTATPIPRTLAMVIYGDMATSVIKQKPAGRQEITTWFVNSKKSKAIEEMMSIKLAAGEQVYIVCAKIDKDETEAGSDSIIGEPVSGDDSVTSVFEMKKIIDSMSNLSQYSSAVLYGSMKEKDKLDTMERFISGDIKILISTTVIEVGVDNPNANVMIIMDADRFGLSTLHQLRGRIGRGDKKSFCLLVSESRSELALSRMKMMCESSDGFELAEKDLDLRGPGDFYGTRQHGIPTLRAANLYTDMKIATEATEAVNKVIEEGGEEAARLNEAIRKMFELRFARKMEQI